MYELWVASRTRIPVKETFPGFFEDMISMGEMPSENWIISQRDDQIILTNSEIRAGI